MIDLDAIVVGDVVVVGPGEVLPVDGTVVSEFAEIDDSALTGEPLQVRYDQGRRFAAAVSIPPAPAWRSGPAPRPPTAPTPGSCGWPSRRPPSPRPWCDWPTGWPPGSFPALAIAGLAWLLSGSATRAVAVLVVPPRAPAAGRTGRDRVRPVPGVPHRRSCPRGGPLETLGRASTLVLDKTGTLTSGRPRGTDIVTAPGWTIDEVLGLAASADQLSPHVLATAIVEEARLHG